MLMLFVDSLAFLIKVIDSTCNIESATKNLVFALIMTIGATPRLSAHFGEGTGSIVRQYVSCTGNENRLIDCPTSSSSCTHSEDAGVTCLPTGESNGHTC